MKRYVITGFIVILFFAIISCISMPLRTIDKLTVEICSEVRGYRDYDTVDKLQYYEAFFVYFEPENLTYKNGLVDVKIDMSIVYPDGSSIDDTIIQGQYRVRSPEELFIAVPLVVPNNVEVGIYTVIVTLIDRYTGKMIQGRDTFRIIAGGLA